MAPSSFNWLTIACRSCRVRLAGLEETADLAAISNGVASLEGTCDSSDLSLLDVILIWLLIRKCLNY